jgi:hypothetical protein
MHFIERAFRFLSVFALISCFIPIASAGLITGSDGSVVITGNSTVPSEEGSFCVQVDYKVYDGTSVSDPLGLTGDLQIEFVLEHLGGDGELPVLDFARFSVFAPDPLSTDIFFTGISAVGSGKSPYDPYGIEDNYGALDGMALHLPPGDDTNSAKFLFFDSVYGAIAGFTTGDISQQLIVTVSSTDLPDDMTLEINLTDEGVHGDTEITIIPEPISAALFAVALSLILKNRRKY